MTCKTCHVPDVKERAVRNGVGQSKKRRSRQVDNKLSENMTGEDLVKQEEHELQYDRQYFDTLDRVDRRDRRGEIVSFMPNPKYRSGYDQINWGKEG